MGRPRVHTADTAAALLAEAERLLHERGTAALSLREVAAAAGTSVQAVYSLFGSKEGLLGALGVHAMELLHQGVDAVPATDDPRRDLVEAALMFRRFALAHPALFEIAFLRVDPEVRPRFRARSADALAALTRRFAPLAAAGLLGDHSVPQALLAFDALCQGLAVAELRGIPSAFAPEPERLWRDAITALVAGFAIGGAAPSQ